MGEHCGPAAGLLKRPLGQMRGPDRLPRSGWDVAVVQTGLGILRETAARFGKGVLRVLQ